MLIRVLTIAAVLSAGSAMAAQAMEVGHRSCLNKEAQRAAVASGQAIPLASALHAMRGHAGRELVRVRLCQTPKGLVYVLTLLARDGKVTRAILDATNGATLTGRKPEG